MRLVLAACLLTPTAALADAPKETWLEDDVDLTKVEHETAASYDVSVTAASDSAGTSFFLASLGGDASYTASFGRERSEYEITIEAAASVSRMEGTVDATGASTHLHLGLGPAAVPLGNQDRAHAAPFPLTFELDHDGELAALPGLAHRPDVKRAPYLSQRFAFATRAYMMELSEDGEDEERPDAPPLDRDSSALELFPFHGELDVTGQDGTRLDATMGGGLLSARSHIYPMTLDAIYAEHHAVQLDDGRYGTTDILWMVRGDIENASTGTAYEVSWGLVLDQRTEAARAKQLDHRDPWQHVGAIGFASDMDLNVGGGAQWKHDVYVTMDGQPAIEDRFFVEGWWQPHLTQLSGKLFAARTKRGVDDAAVVEWTGGVELDARRDVGLLAVGLHAEGGQSYYATLDGNAPVAPSFGARAALTVSRSKRWVRGTR